MLSVVSGNTGGAVAMERLRGGTPGRGGSGGRTRHHQHQLQVMVAAQRDRAVRLHSVHTDLELDLPPSIALPDGEEHPYGTSARLKLRDSEQESEIYQKCVRPPPNRTVFESESPPPYRSHSAGLLGSLASNSTCTSNAASSEWSSHNNVQPAVVRCHSLSNSSHHQPHHQHSQFSSSTISTSAPTHTKSDFLQRTVKIFTGNKNKQNSQLNNSSVIVPCVVVPKQHRQLVVPSVAVSASSTTTATPTVDSQTNNSSSSRSSTKSNQV